MSGHIKNAGIRFDPDNYVYLEYDPETPSLNLLIIQNGEIINPMVDYVTNDELTTILGDYVSTSDLTAALDDYVTDSDLNTALGDYVTDSDLNTALGDYVTDSELQSEIQDFAKLKKVEHTYSGTYTIPSTGYVSLGTAPSPIDNKVIASILIASWGSNNGGVTPALASGNQVYLIGNANNSITDFTLRFIYYL